MALIAIHICRVLFVSPLNYLDKSQQLVWSQQVSEALAVLWAIVVVDVNLLHAQPLVVLYPLHGIAVLQSADGADGDVLRLLILLP